MIGSKSMRTLAAAGAGAGLAYLLDPDRGRARRARLRDRSTSMLRREMRTVQRRAHYERGRVEGLRHKVNARRHGEQPPENDQVLVDKVRSEVLGRWPGVGHRVNIDACAGVVTIRGQLDADVAYGIDEAIGAVSGVTRVVNLLHEAGQDAPNKADALGAARR